MKPAPETIARALALTLAVAAAGCGNGDDAGGGATAIDPASLCLASGCGSKTTLLTIPDAEDLLFSPDGRLFVSGGVNVYEITRDGDTWAATPLLDGSCNFTGLVIAGDVLYADCFSGALYAARLTAHPALQMIATLDGMHAANGMARGPDGALYLVNGPLATSALPDPKIVRLRLDPADPFHVVEQVDWLTAGLSFPNGLQARGDDLYVSDSTPQQAGQIKRIAIGPDGSAGAPQLVGTIDGLPDDFSLVGADFLIASYTLNNVTLMGADGAIVASSDPGSFSGPSQVRVGTPPLFSPTDLVVTEKGLVGDDDSSVGNVLSVFRRNP